MLESVSKAGRVLSLFTSDVPEWGVSQVALELGVAKSSAHALLVTLDDVGLVRRLPDGRYRLGWRILQLNRTLLQSTDFLGSSRARLAQLADGLHATVHIAGLRGHDVVYLDKFRGSCSPDVAESGIGMSMPAHCTALGKVLLASLDTAGVDAIVERYGLARRTDCTITALPALHNELRQVGARGLGHDQQEAVIGVCCVAAPIRDRDGRVSLAVSITLPALRFRQGERQLCGLVRATTAGISQDLRVPSAELAAVS